MTIQEIFDSIKSVRSVPTHEKMPRAQRNIYILKSVSIFMSCFFISYMATTGVHYMESKAEERNATFTNSGDNIRYEFYGNFADDVEEASNQSEPEIQDIAFIIKLGEELNGYRNRTKQ